MIFGPIAVGKLSVGTFQSVSAMLLPRVVAQMREVHPTLELSVFETDVDEKRA